MLVLVVAVSYLGSGRTRATGVALAQTPSLTPTTSGKPDLVKQYQRGITPAKLAARLYFLASDFLEGRETATRGQKLAAQYLASQYRLMGLTPKGTGKSADQLSPSAYFQPFAVYRQTPESSRLEVTVDGKPVVSSSFSANKHDDLSYFLRGSLENAGGSVVFAGYGIGDDSLGYNDYAALAAKRISIEGKWVVILGDEPLVDANTSRLPTKDRKPSGWTNGILKRRALLAAGKPAGVLEVRMPSPLRQGTFADEVEKASARAASLRNLSLEPSTAQTQTFAISAELANQILAPSGRKIEELRQQIDRTLRPDVFEVNGARILTTIEPSKPLATENVLAFIEGSDPQLKDEVVIISSHYDHLGIDPTVKGDQIFNGAADDGSGVVATLEMAQAFMAAKRDGFGPRRSILFINFSGEEKGILGSNFYANQQPVVPLDQTVANINMDGVGGLDAKHPAHSRNYIYIVGDGDLSKEMIETNRRVKDLTAINLDLTPGPNFPSDQRNFQAQFIPFIYYSTGLTEHYHTPGDEPATVDYEHLARVTQLVFGTAWEVANQNSRPAGIDRSKLTLVGYSCPPCGLECDDAVYDHAGSCPICGMALTPKYSIGK